MYTILFEFEFRSDSTSDSCSLRLKKKFLWIHNGRNVVSTLAPPFLIGSSSSLQVTRTTITVLMSLNFRWIPTLTAELGALER